jgi:hypothetical protein
MPIKIKHCSLIAKENKLLIPICLRTIKRDINSYQSRIKEKAEREKENEAVSKKRLLSCYQIYQPLLCIPTSGL